MNGNNNENFNESASALSDQGFMAKVVDKDATYTYIAVAMPGTAVTDAKWSVCRIVTDGTDAEGTTDWAGGTNAFKHKADAIAGLSYS